MARQNNLDGLAQISGDSLAGMKRHSRFDYPRRGAVCSSAAGAKCKFRNLWRSAGVISLRTVTLHNLDAWRTWVTFHCATMGAAGGGVRGTPRSALSGSFLITSFELPAKSIMCLIYPVCLPWTVNRIVYSSTNTRPIATRAPAHSTEISELSSRKRQRNVVSHVHVRAEKFKSACYLCARPFRGDNFSDARAVFFFFFLFRATQSFL